jgi:hypothetical protein
MSARCARKKGANAVSMSCKRNLTMRCPFATASWRNSVNFQCTGHKNAMNSRRRGLVRRLLAGQSEVLL